MGKLAAWIGCPLYPSRKINFSCSPSLQNRPICLRVTLAISAATDEACAVKSLYNLFERFSKAYYQPSFVSCAGTFSRNYVTRKLQKGICTLGYNRLQKKLHGPFISEGGYDIRTISESI